MYKKNILLIITFCITIAFITNQPIYSSTTYQVGPTKPYTSLHNVVSLLEPGDIVEVDGNSTYSGDVTFIKSGTATDKITITGIKINGNRPIISGGTNTVHFKTSWPYDGSGTDNGSHYIFEGFEII